MRQRPPKSARTYTLFPYTTLFRSDRRLGSHLSVVAGKVHYLVGGCMAFGNRLAVIAADDPDGLRRSEEHTSELQSLMRISYAVFCLEKKMTVEQRTYIDIAIKSL